FLKVKSMFHKLWGGSAMSVASALRPCMTGVLTCGIAAGYRVQDPADRDPEDKPVLDTIAAVSRLSTLRPDSEQRWRAGQVRFAGQWTTPDTVAVLVAAYPDTIAYQARREKCPDTAEAHFKLAQWCRSRGLIAEQRAHLLIAARLDPNDQRAHRALGL